jgi:hypothetical protein
MSAERKVRERRSVFWSLIARMLSRPAVFNFVRSYAMKRPYFHIGDYMHRFWIVPYSWGWPFAARIHHIKRPDADPFLHDHPWNWRTIILSGSYVEEDVFGKLHRRSEGETRYATAETLHRIDEVSEGGVWTLFITYRKRNSWGFMVGDPSRKIYWREYESGNGRDA